MNQVLKYKLQKLLLTATIIVNLLNYFFVINNRFRLITMQEYLLGPFGFGEFSGLFMGIFWLIIFGIIILLSILGIVLILFTPKQKSISWVIFIINITAIYFTISLLHRPPLI